MSIVHKVMLTGEQFRKLVKGEICKIATGPIGEKEIIELGLSDIGFGVMRNYLTEAEHEAKTSTSSDPTVQEGSREG